MRPSKHIKISKTEKDPAKLERLYQLGVHDAKQFFKKLFIKSYIENKLFSQTKMSHLSVASFCLSK